MRTRQRGLVILSLFVLGLGLGLGLPRPASPCSSFAFLNNGALSCEQATPAAPAVPAQAPPKPASAFDFSFEVTLPALPVEVYDALTGDISGWWDHSFMEKPFRLYIEPRPGGGFYEIFDKSGDGARHAVVIYAERGKKLRFEGPLGLSGQAVSFVTTYDLAPSGQAATRLTVSVHGSGEMDAEVPGIVEKVWKHFILERFKPYIESGAHKKLRR